MARLTVGLDDLALSGRMGVFSSGDYGLCTRLHAVRRLLLHRDFDRHVTGLLEVQRHGRSACRQPAGCGP